PKRPLCRKPLLFGQAPFSRRAALESRPTGQPWCRGNDSDEGAFVSHTVAPRIQLTRRRRSRCPWDLRLGKIGVTVDLGISLLLASGDSLSKNLWISDRVSPPAESIRSLSVLVLAITGFIFIVVEGILIYAIVRFRRRAGAARTEPPQVYGSKPIEIAWTAAP